MTMKMIMKIAMTNNNREEKETIDVRKYTPIVKDIKT
jgi:hypothetical protein